MGQSFQKFNPLILVITYSVCQISFSFYTMSLGERLLQQGLQLAINGMIPLNASYGPLSRRSISQPWSEILGTVIMSSITSRNPAIIEWHTVQLAQAQNMSKWPRISYPSASKKFQNSAILSFEAGPRKQSTYQKKGFDHCTNDVIVNFWQVLKHILIEYRPGPCWAFFDAIALVTLISIWAS